MDYKSKIEEVVLNVDLTLRESELLEKEILEIVSLSRKSLLKEVKERIEAMEVHHDADKIHMINGLWTRVDFIDKEQLLDVLTSLEKKE